VNTQQLPTITPTVDPSERELAIVAWLMNATVYRDGEPLIENQKLLGNEVMSQKYAAIMEKHFVENGTALGDLVEWMKDYQRGQLLVRCNPVFFPFIAQSLRDHLNTAGVL
jgi:hypothetical protein